MNGASGEGTGGEGANGREAEGGNANGHGAGGDRADAHGAGGDERGVGLTGVPETLLWNLYQRACEAREPKPVLDDPKAVELVDRLTERGYPFEATFGPPNPLLAQGQALRVRSFDSAVSDFLRRHPDGTVVTLAEGLETQFWRVDNGRARWLCVELPQTAEVRRSLLPDGERRTTLAMSALDTAWHDEVDPANGVLITAQGLLMYLQPSEVHALIDACAERFPGQALVFDAVPRWFSERTLDGAMRTAQGYTAPPMPWALDAGRLQTLRSDHPRITDLRELRVPRGRGLYYGVLAPLLQRLPGVRNVRPTMTAIARFAG